MFIQKKKNALLLTNITFCFYLCTKLKYCTPYLSVTPCTSNPCQNQGACLISGSSYQCSCQQGFSGINCESKIHCFTLLFPIYSLAIT